MHAHNGLHTPANWRELYEAALLELDPTRHAILSRQAEQALFARLHQLGDTEYREEREAINDALNALHDLHHQTNR